MRKFGLAAVALVCAWGGGVWALERSDFRRPLDIPLPQDRPYDPMRVALGKMLFFDPRVSGAQNMSCASCHNPSFGWEVPTKGPIGAQNEMLGRQAPTILNTAWLPHFFWDGRAATLEEQAGGPITAPVEMNADLDEVARRLGDVATYRRGFEQAFPNEGLTAETLLVAIATFERTVVAGWSPFDRWVEGDADAISAEAQRGFDLFVGEGHCADCHSGWNFTDNLFHDIGLPTTDIGRAGIAEARVQDRHAFKTPGLRNITQRAPYMHDGSMPDLETVMVHYVSGGLPRDSRSPLMRPLALQPDEVAAIVAFMETLTAEVTAVPTPNLPVD